ncbi:MAG: hypothetical protein QNL04_10025 [SAR324 cluster bacterium]|nr:hypothetical protein [SAR324 cluster bacterium]
MKKLKFLLVAVVALGLVAGCKNSDGTVTILLKVNNTFADSSTDTDNPIINWACVVLSTSKTACIYYYNGTLQTRSNISSSGGWTYAPGTSYEYDYVGPGATYLQITGGDHDFSSFHREGSVSETTSGTIRLMDDMSGANMSPASWSDTADRTWTITLYPAATPDTSHD